MLFSVFIWLTVCWLEHPSFKKIMVCGFIAGLIILIRPTNVLVLLIPFLFGITSIENVKERMNVFWKNRTHLIIFTACMFVVFVPQFFHWKFISGQWLLYSYVEERFYFLKPHLLSVFFSYRKGWLVYTPIMGFALMGIFILRRYAKDFFWLVVIFTALNIWIVSSWWCWWYGGCFGMRAMIESYALLSFPLAATTQFFLQNKWLFVRTLYATIIMFFTWMNIFQTNQYSTTQLHYECTSKALYWKIFATKQWPEHYNQMLKCPDVEKGGWEEESQIEKIWD
jgi:hypothetical protein